MQKLPDGPVPIREQFLFQKGSGDLLGRPLIALDAGMQMVAGVIFREEEVRLDWVPEGHIKVNAAVNEVCCADKVIIGVAQFLAEGGIGAPAAHGQQGAHIDLVAVALALAM